MHRTFNPGSRERYPGGPPNLLIVKHSPLRLFPRLRLIYTKKKSEIVSTIIIDDPNFTNHFTTGIPLLLDVPGLFFVEARKRLKRGLVSLGLVYIGPQRLNCS